MAVNGQGFETSYIFSLTCPTDKNAKAAPLLTADSHAALRAVAHKPLTQFCWHVESAAEPPQIIYENRWL